MAEVRILLVDLFFIYFAIIIVKIDALLHRSGTETIKGNNETEITKI